MCTHAASGEPWRSVRMFHSRFFFLFSFSTAAASYASSRLLYSCSRSEGRSGSVNCAHMTKYDFHSKKRSEINRIRVPFRSASHDNSESLTPLLAFQDRFKCAIDYDLSRCSASSIGKCLYNTSDIRIDIFRKKKKKNRIVRKSVNFFNNDSLSKLMRSHNAIYQLSQFVKIIEQSVFQND